MGKYGNIAIKATELAQTGKDPIYSWEMISKEIFKHNPASQNKSCPKNSFIGLCSEGKIKGIPSGNYTRSKENKLYALKALALLQVSQKQLSEKELWLKVLKDIDEDINKIHNQQMDVVLSLWNRSLIT